MRDQMRDQKRDQMRDEKRDQMRDEKRDREFFFSLKIGSVVVQEK